MKKVLFTIALLAGSFAQADGFTCQTDSGLVVKVYNNTQPSKGTRTAAVMVISDSRVNQGNKTIARFTEANGRVESSALVYTADVDLRFTDSARGGELIAGTKLGYIDTIKLYVDFSYARPVPAGDELNAALQVVKRDGEKIVEEAICQRYLKN